MDKTLGDAVFCEERTSLSSGRSPLRHLELGRLLPIRKMFDNVSENIQILFELYNKNSQVDDTVKLLPSC